MPIGNVELGNVLSESNSRDNPSAELEYLCRWEDRWYYSAMAVGGLIGGSYYVPLAYPYLPGLIANECKIEKVGQVAGGGMIPTARLIVSFGIPKCKDPSSNNLLDLAEINIECSGEGMPLPKSAVKWGQGAPSDLAGQPLRDEDIQSCKLIPYAEASIKMKYCTSWQLDYYSQMCGYVNSDSVNFADATFAPEELLFIGCGIEQTLTAEGLLQVERTLKVGIKKKQGGVGGWLQLYIPDRDVWAKTDPPLYPNAPFSELFTD